MEINETGRRIEDDLEAIQKVLRSFDLAEVAQGWQSIDDVALAIRDALFPDEKANHLVHSSSRQWHVSLPSSDYVQMSRQPL